MFKQDTMPGRAFRAVYIAGAMVAIAGCAGNPPTASLATAEMAVSRAQEAKAAEHASLELHLAQEKLARAQSALEEDDYDTARRQAEQAAVDARFAEAKAASISASQRIRDVEQTMDTLEQQTDAPLPLE
jgi:Domain of unknown function (DUF4398)